jgi:hypothetical protein
LTEVFRRSESHPQNINLYFLTTKAASAIMDAWYLLYYSKSHTIFELYYTVFGPQ